MKIYPFGVNHRAAARVETKDGFDLISNPLSFGRLWYDKPDHAIGYAMHYSRSNDAVIRGYDSAGNVMEWAKKSTQAGLFMLDNRKPL